MIYFYSISSFRFKNFLRTIFPSSNSIGLRRSFRYQINGCVFVPLDNFPSYQVQKFNDELRTSNKTDIGTFE